MVIWPKLIIEVHDASGSVKYQDVGSDINGLRFSSKDGVGYDVCTYPIVRDVRFSYPELSIGNKVKLSAGDRVAWEGQVNSVNIQAAEDTGIEVTCYGYFALLTKRINATPLTSGMRGSDWILANLMADTDLDFERGNIYTEDYVFPADLDLGDDLYYNTILSKINEYNGFVMGVGADRKFDFYPKPDMISYKVRMADCHTSLVYERDSITNYVLVKYTTDGTAYETFWWPDDGPDQASSKLYGRCDGILPIEEYCTEAMAQQKAEVALRAGTTMRPASDLTLERIYDVNTGVESDVRLIKPGSLVFIEDLATVQTSVNDAATLNEMSTFAIAETEFDIESGEVTA